MALSPLSSLPPSARVAPWTPVKSIPRPGHLGADADGLTVRPRLDHRRPTSTTTRDEP